MCQLREAEISRFGKATCSEREERGSLQGTLSKHRDLFDNSGSRGLWRLKSREIAENDPEIQSALGRLKLVRERRMTEAEAQKEVEQLRTELQSARGLIKRLRAMLREISKTAGAGAKIRN